MKDMVNPFSSKKFWYTMVALGVQTIQDVAKEKYGSVELKTDAQSS